MDRAPKSQPAREPVDRLLEKNVKWARRASDRSLTVVATELHDLVSLHAELGLYGVDRLLDVVADRLAPLRDVDSVRTGNGFTSISRAPGSTFEAFGLADRIARTVARIAVVGTPEMSLRASIGVCHASALRSGDSGTLRRAAQFALDEAKYRGGGTIVVFSPDLYRRRTDRMSGDGMQYEPVVSLDDVRPVDPPSARRSFPDAES